MDATAGHDSPLARAAQEHEREILGYLRRMLGDAMDAEDAWQDTLLRALGDGRAPVPDVPPRGWLYRVATNRAIDLLRRRRHTASPLEDAPATGTPEGEVEQRMELAAVRRFVRGLPPKQRAALVMRRYQGLEYAEIAEALGCSEESARANAYQALRRLRAHFREEMK